LLYVKISKKDNDITFEKDKETKFIKENNYNLNSSENNCTYYEIVDIFQDYDEDEINLNNFKQKDEENKSIYDFDLPIPKINKIYHIYK